MKKILIALASAATLTFGVAGAPTQASATPAWVVPVIIATGIGGLALGAAASASARPVAPVAVAEPVATAPAIYQGPDAAIGCYPARARINGIWRRVRICD